ncbi:MAG: 23S rRNA (adenine(2030)-N(6))-methyltransferase RlmJ [Gammaproteobacteria bacterium]|nr:23S rRNA (adenine(2030)-N(6))-methyltransferase RlmJ [Gammaproteobacteria bacterium]MCP5424888.1 23S rRNA (adenine(2030)-N(6))-methyltransferase RlmJ [Gammaproteobacteria bacterium]MCP5458136.1 23S rRNA (adenine(2030)-N(6))-methyltransferase RlmJ [Gammaproteobacteria bacterium]
MLSYRHHYHAGNFADVFKHAILIQLVHTLQRKERPLCLMETHAGAGRYDLNADPARKNAEHRQGILRFWKKGPIAPELADYLKIVSAFNTERGEPGLRWYPGSPRILRALLRPQDRLLLMEMHPADHRLLKDEFSGDRQVGVHQGDGYAALRALLPPREARGLVLLDPAYERRDEFQRLLNGLLLARQRWPAGVLAAWYPVLNRQPSAHFQQALVKAGIPAVLCAELGLFPYDAKLGMNGCGMIIVNPPWQLDATLQTLLTKLRDGLRQNEPAHIRLEWLSPAP